MLRAIKYRLYPTDSQKEFFARSFGCHRKMWNLLLGDKIESYSKTRSFGKQTPAKYKEKYPYLKEVDSLSLANVQMDMEKALRDHFKNPKHFGFPKFKKKHKSKQSYTTNNQNGTVAVGDGFVKLPKIGKVKAVIHRIPCDDWKLKHATVSKKGDRYFVSVAFDVEETAVTTASEIRCEDGIGLDASVPNLFVDSNGIPAGMPKYYKQSLRQLKRLQKKLSKKVGNKKGEMKSKNWCKLNDKINNLYTHIANKRMDFLHKQSSGIINRYSFVGLEDISVKEFLKSFSSAEYHRSVFENGWYAFTQMLIYKGNARGVPVIKTDRMFPSSQKCSCCGNINPAVKNVSIREWDCPTCGIHHDRDINAAVNIRNEAFRMLTA